MSRQSEVLDQPHALRVNVIGSDEYQYVGPFDSWECAVRFGEGFNTKWESYEAVPWEDVPLDKNDQRQYTAPEEVVE